VTDGREQGVVLIAVRAFEEVTAQMTVVLQVADDGFDGGAASQLAFDCTVDAALLAGDEDT
jgi:hypothetical protein